MTTLHIFNWGEGQATPPLKRVLLVNSGFTIDVIAYCALLDMPLFKNNFKANNQLLLQLVGIKICILSSVLLTAGRAARPSGAPRSTHLVFTWTMFFNLVTNKLNFTFKH